MVTTLLESGAKRKRSKAGLAASVAIHGALIAGALTMGGQVAASTLEKPKEEKIEFIRPTTPEPEPKKVYVAPKKAAPKPAAPKKAAPAPRVRAPEPPKPVAAAPTPAPAPINVPVNVPVITTPTVVPTSIPAVDPNALATTSEIVARASDVAAAAAASGSGSGRVTTESGGDVGESRGDGSAWSSEQVDKEVQPMGRAAPRYPEMLRSSNVEGTVVVRFVVGPNGRVEMSSVQTVDSPHDQFTAAVKTALRSMRFRPAEVRGKKVRQLVEQSFTFRLDR